MCNARKITGTNKSKRYLVKTAVHAPNRGKMAPVMLPPEMCAQPIPYHTTARKGAAKPDTVPTPNRTRSAPRYRRRNSPFVKPAMSPPRASMCECGRTKNVPATLATRDAFKPLISEDRHPSILAQTRADVQLAPTCRRGPTPPPNSRSRFR
jgi:hypothetical protein